MSSSGISVTVLPQPRHWSARLWRAGGMLSLLGGAGTFGALFLPWLSLTLVSEQICSEDGCISTPDSASIHGWEIFISHPFLFFVLLILLTLSAVINLTSGVVRLRISHPPRAPRWRPVPFWGALLVTSGALTAFFPWLVTFPLPQATALVDGHVITYQFALGLYVAIGAVLVSLVGLLLRPGWYAMPSAPDAPTSTGSTAAQVRQVTPDHRFSWGLALVSLTLLLVFASFFIASTATFIPRMNDNALHWWEVLFFLVLPPVVGGLTLASWLHAFRRHQRVWLPLLSLSLMHVCLGWAYVVSGALGPLGDLGVSYYNAGTVLEPLWWGYLVSIALCGVYAVLLLSPRERESTRSRA